MATQRTRRSAHRVPLDLLDRVLFLPGIWLATGLGISLRLVGPFFVAIPVGTCLLYALARRVTPPRILSAYLGYCVFVAILSRYRLMPTSWQIYFYQDAIVRQMVPTLGFFAVAWASKAYFRRRLQDGNAFLGGRLIVTLSCIAAPVVMLQQGLRYEGEGPIASIFGLYGAFINNMLIGFVFIAASIYFTRDLRRYCALGFTLLIGITSHFLQVKLLAGAIVATRLHIRGRTMAIGIALLLMTSYAIALNFIPMMARRDPNDGLRLTFLVDVLRSTADTRGLGVGFGKESVRWRYHFPGRPVFTFLPNPRTMSHARMLEALSTGVHNSFAEALLRTGLPGLILLVASFVAVFPPGSLPRDVQD
ncbi:MAG: hypothetical protein ACREDL_10775, partial [Bradyrhizobium sp.]